jgi:hypothetical protein
MLLYGLEQSNMTNEEEERKEVADTKLLRPLWG